MKNSHHIVFTGGGTGGHLFPGLAVAGQLAAELPHLRITFVGSGKPLERQHVEAAGFEYLVLPSRPLPRRAGETLSFVVENLAGYLAARRFLRHQRVAVVIGLGGYASVPMGRAAVQGGVPLVLLEQNIIPGRANRWLARRASLVCASYEATVANWRVGCPLRVTGNPIRTPPGPIQDIARRPRRLLVLGGSSGAQSLNENVPRALYKCRPSLAGWQIVHQSGEADLAATGELYRKLAIEATVEPFLENLPRQMAAASLAVCRAGGTTLAELAATALPAVLIPYPHAAGDHQRKNAEVYAAAGGAVLLDQRDCRCRLDDALAQVLDGLLGDESRRGTMSAAMQRLARPEATAHVAELVWSLVTSQARRRRAAA